MAVVEHDILSQWGLGGLSLACCILCIFLLETFEVQITVLNNSLSLTRPPVHSFTKTQDKDDVSRQNGVAGSRTTSQLSKHKFDSSDELPTTPFTPVDA